MEQLARAHINQLKQYDRSLNTLLFITLFSVANLVIHYLLKVPLINSLLELLEWNNYLAPAASAPRYVLVTFQEHGQLWWGIAAAAGLLLPYFLLWLLGICTQKKEEHQRRWLILGMVWYGLDTVAHILLTVLALVEDFSVPFLLWELFGLSLRWAVYKSLWKGTRVRKQLIQLHNQMILGMAQIYAATHGKEALATVTVGELVKMKDAYIRAVAEKVYNEDMDRFIEEHC
ncbi:MAG: hypothetical protein IJ518_04725 [Clostridia bacterium]|nr:hypothetical protein [Clostridia bacterium]